MFRSDSRIIETSANAAGSQNLSFLVLENITVGAVKYSRGPGDKRSRVRSSFETLAACFHPEQMRLRILNKRVERSDSVASTANAGNNGVGKAPFGLYNLLPRLAPDN